jgi:pyruvate/2-oxoglutarate dehydrogenase complex dihydrolipoamide dehydrogenase (E3) component
MPNFDFDIGILGGGAAGLTVASGAAQLGAKTLLVEKENRLGGDCLHYGCVPSKTLIRTANVYHLIKNARMFGLPDVAQSKVDFREVSARIKSVIDEIQRHDSEERFCGLGVKVEFGEAAFTDEHSIRLNGRTISAKAWVIATASGMALPLKDSTIRHITNRDILPGQPPEIHMICIGGVNSHRDGPGVLASGAP